MKKTVKKLFGTLADGAEVYSFKMENSSGISATVITFGGCLQSLTVPDKNGKLANVVCGYDSLEPYIFCGGCYGALIGRCANRIGQSRFTVDGKEYLLPPNDGKNQLHGGAEGFWHKNWSAEAEECTDSSSVVLTIFSPDGDMGYPGNLHARVTYSLNEAGELSLRYTAETDKATVVNFTNHSYFDLCGVGSGRTLDEVLELRGDKICNSDKALIPDGTFTAVKGTPYDFNEPKPICRDINEDFLLLRHCNGYDTNYFIKDSDNSIKTAAILKDPVSGRKMTVRTNHPCIQLYTANMVNEEDPPFSGGIPQRAHCAVCLETQAMPDAVNHPGFTNVVLLPGEKYDYTTVFAFCAE